MTQKGRLFHEFLWMNKFIIGYFYPLNVIFYIIQANFIVTYLYTHHPDRECFFSSPKIKVEMSPYERKIEEKIIKNGGL